MRHSRVRDFIARLVLRGFESEEADDVLRDLGELASSRGGVRGFAYFWIELVKYPVCRAWDRVRHGGGRREREATGGGGMDAFLKDMRYAGRSLRRNPGFSAMAAAILMLSMGSTTAMFSLVKGVLLDPLPLERPDDLVSFWLGLVEGDGRSRMTPGNFTDIAALDGVFSHVAAFSGRTSSLSVNGESAFLRGGAVTPAYFEALGVQPVVGRTFRAEEGDSGGEDVVVLSHHIWTGLFGADPAIVGRTLDLDGVAFQVIGVAPPGVYPTHATVSATLPFSVSNQDFFVPLRYGPAGWANRRSHVVGAIGRLAVGTDWETAEAAMGTLSARLRQDEPLNANERIVMTSFTEEVVGDVRFALLTLLGSVILVLLIAVVNVGALFVLRTDDRRGELEIRAALGAPRRRLIRQLALESLVIVVISAGGAVLLAQGGLELVRRLVPYQVPRLAEVQLEASALAIILVTGMVVAVTFALAPVFSAPSRSGGPTGRRAATRGVAQRRLQSSVVALQAGLAVIVLVGAGLFTRSYVALRSVDTGFGAHDTWAMSVPAPLETLEDIVREVRAMPGVAAAAIAYDHPLSRSWGDGFRIEGVELSDTDARPSGSLRPFGEDYFSTVAIDVVEGRVPSRLDLAGPVPYAVINETLRDRWFATGGAIGSRIILPTAQRMFGTDGAFEVVGVVRDVRFLGPDQPVSPALYVPLSHFRAGASTLLVRPERADVDVLTGVRAVVREADARLAVQRARRLGAVLDDLLARPRFNMLLLLSFAAMALTLCGLGSYGLVGRVVVTRFREIGIRRALGADRVTLARSVVASALLPMALGSMLGVAVAFGLGGLLRVTLFEVSAGDPFNLVASAAFVLVVGVVAAVVPTVRAISVNPASTLRDE